MKASVKSVQQSYIAASEPYLAAADANNTPKVVAATPKQVAAIQNYIAQLSALKPSSSAAGVAQKKVISALKQQAVLYAELAEAAVANNQSVVNALGAKLKVVNAQLKAAVAQLAAALP